MKAIILSLAFALSATWSFAQNLTLDVRGVENVKGYLYIGIYS